jgi:hypothetical protein
MIPRGIIIRICTMIRCKRIIASVARIWVGRRAAGIVVRSRPQWAISVQICVAGPIRPPEANAESPSPAPSSPAPPVPASVAVKSRVPTCVDTAMKAAVERSNDRRKRGSGAVKPSRMEAPTTVKSPNANMAAVLCQSGLRRSEKCDGNKKDGSRAFFHCGLCSSVIRLFKFCQLLKPYSRAIRY